MNRMKFLTLILLFSFFVMGAGYAYWSETVTINSTVSTGNLSVEFEPYDDQVEVEDPVVIVDGSLKKRPEHRVTPFDLQDNKHTLIAKFVDVFPGLYYSVPFKMRNNGTIPAVFKRCTINSDIKDSCMASGESEAYLLAELYTNLKINSLYFKIFEGNRQIGPVIYCVDETVISLSQLETQINNTLGNGRIRLEPGQRLQVSSELDENTVKKLGGNIQFLFGPDFDNDFEKREFTVNINMEWKQFNEPN